MAAQGIKQDPKYDSYDFPTISPTNLPGHPGHTTPEQDAQVQQFRAILEQAGFTQRLDTLTLVWTFIRQSPTATKKLARRDRQKLIAFCFTASIPPRPQVQC